MCILHLSSNIAKQSRWWTAEFALQQMALKLQVKVDEIIRQLEIMLTQCHGGATPRSRSTRIS